MLYLNRQTVYIKKTN